MACCVTTFRDTALGLLRAKARALAFTAIFLIIISQFKCLLCWNSSCLVVFDCPTSRQAVVFAACLAIVPQPIGCE